ncbi:MAG: tRNA lysidine(34) synthetase TilS [Vampirovibrionales bacterium]
MMSPFFAFNSAQQALVNPPSVPFLDASDESTNPTPPLRLPSLQQHLQHWLEQHQVLKIGRATKLIVAYSGGADSTALLHALCALRSTLHLEVVAAYFHHNWRGTPPPELPRLHKNCQAYRVPLVFMPPQSQPQHPNAEADAREQRYQRLGLLASQLHADAVLTAHHQDDQIETLLFRLVRGTGMDGLLGMAPTRPLPTPEGTTLLARPLLEVPRSTLASYIEEQQLLTFEDPSNNDAQKSRNWLRHKAVPLLEGRFPQVRQSLLRLASTLENDRFIVEQVIQEQWQQVCISTAPPKVYQQGPTLDALRLTQLALPYQRRLIRHYLQAQAFEPDLKTIEHTLAFLNKATVGATQPRRFSLGVQPSPQATHKEVRLFLVHQRDRLWMEATPTGLYDTEAQQRQQEAICPMTGGLVPYPWDANQGLRMEPWPKRAGHFDVKKLLPARSSEVFVNASTVEHQRLVLRTRRAGDWIRPIGMNGKRTKVKDLFIHHKVPQPLRETWPLVAIEGSSEVLWVPTLTMSEALRSTSKKSPTHTWMIGDLHVLEQLRTLRILLDEPAEATDTLGLETDGLEDVSSPLLETDDEIPTLKPSVNLLADDEELAALHHDDNDDSDA